MLIKLLTLSILTLAPLAMAKDSNSAGNERYFAEMEVHSTAGIANQVQRPDQQFEEYEPSFEESSPYLEDDAAREELAPPVTVEKISPTRSRVITRTITRPSSKYPQSEGIGIAPVIAPINDDGGRITVPPPSIPIPPPLPTR